MDAFRIVLLQRGRQIKCALLMSKSSLNASAPFYFLHDRDTKRRNSLVKAKPAFSCSGGVEATRDPSACSWCCVLFCIGWIKSIARRESPAIYWDGQCAGFVALPPLFRPSATADRTFALNRISGTDYSWKGNTVCDI